MQSLTASDAISDCLAKSVGGGWGDPNRSESCARDQEYGCARETTVENLACAPLTGIWRVGFVIGAWTDVAKMHSRHVQLS